MVRARAHRRLAGFGAFALLALTAELVGRSLTLRLDIGRHVPTPSYSGADYYPFLLAGVKIGIGLMLAAITWRFIKARAAARAAERLLAHVGGRAQAAPRVRIRLTLRSWAIAYGVTAGFYLLQTDSEQSTDAPGHCSRHRAQIRLAKTRTSHRLSSGTYSLGSGPV